MAEHTIIVTRRWPEAVEAELVRMCPGARLSTDDTPFSREDLRAALLEADALLPTVSDPLSADLFGDDVRTRFIGNFGVGYNHIALEQAQKLGIVVTNTPGVLTDTTADTAMMLMLMVARRAGEAEREVRAHRWSGWRPTHMLGTDITGKTLGILGMGRIGRAVAKRAHHGFGMPIVYYNPSDVETLDVPASRLDTIEEVLQRADTVSLHMPGGSSNSHIINADRLALMKPSAYLVNTARGDVIDQPALIRALEEHQIAGAGLDVFETEPDIPAALRRLENTVLLPHLGSATVETRTAMGMLVLENLQAYLNGQEPPCRVI
jgi:lactate dehydrogenase-like 2-hydroxyacid dehydrogenase